MVEYGVRSFDLFLVRFLTCTFDLEELFVQQRDLLLWRDGLQYSRIPYILGGWMAIKSSRDQGTYLSPLIGWHDHSETCGNRAPDYTQRAYCATYAVHLGGLHYSRTFQSMPKVAGQDGNLSSRCRLGLSPSLAVVGQGSWVLGPRGGVPPSSEIQINAR